MSRSDADGSPPVTQPWAIAMPRPPRARRSCGRGPRGRLAEDRCVACRDAELAGDRLRLEVGDRVERDRAVRVVDHDRVGEPGDAGPDVHAGHVDQVAVDAEPRCGVVVAAADHDPGAGIAQPQQRGGVERDGRQRRDRPVEHVARDGHDVDGLGAHHLDQVVDERLLRGALVGAVQRAAQVPVGGVQQPHARDGRQQVRQPAAAAPCTRREEVRARVQRARARTSGAR